MPLHQRPQFDRGKLAIAHHHPAMDDAAVDVRRRAEHQRRGRVLHGARIAHLGLGINQSGGGVDIGAQ